MEIGFYIADLLRNQDEVSLPGLGTFTKERVAGSYDISSNSFAPPSYLVSFNRKLDNLTTLSQYIGAKKNLSQSSAEYFVKKFTTTVLDLLQTSGTAEIKPLGTIRQDEDELTFEASSRYQIAGKFYGLKPIPELKDILPASTRDSDSQAANAFIQLDAAPGLVQENVIEDFTHVQGSEIEEEEYIEESQSSRTLLLISGAIVLAVIAAISLYFFNPAVRDKFNSVFAQPDTTLSAPRPADISPKITTPAVTDSANSQATTAKVAADSSSKPAPTVSEPEIETITYEIVGATFGKSSEAESYIKTMKKKGFQAKVLENMPGTLFKVSLASFPDYKSAQKELNRIVKEVEKTAWTTKYKSKKSNK